MKAFLLAAGHGSRLRPLTDALPKCLVPIRGKPLLDIWLELCSAHGITEVIINLHSKADIIRKHLGSRTSSPAVHVFEESTLLGSAGTIRANRAWVESELLFWIFYSDVLTNLDLSAMREFHLQRPKVATLGVCEVANPSQCGIAEVNEEGIIDRFEEKPEDPRGNLAFAGVIVATPKFLTTIPDTAPCDIGFDVLSRLRGEMRAFRIADYLLDVGTWPNYERAQREWPGLRN